MPQLQNVIGQPLAQALGALAAFQNVVWRDEDMAQIKLRNQPPARPDNNVVWQHPPPPADGADVAANVRITLIVAYELPQPDYTGMSVDAAERVARMQGLKLEFFEDDGALAAKPVKRTRLVKGPKLVPGGQPPKRVSVGGTIGVILVKVP